MAGVIQKEDKKHPNPGTSQSKSIKLVGQTNLYK